MRDGVSVSMARDADLPKETAVAPASTAAPAANAALGSDVVQDVRPWRVAGVNQPIHQMFLVTVGTPLIDNCDLEALSAAARQRGRWEFMFTFAALRVPGGTGSPLNPIATFRGATVMFQFAEGRWLERLYAAMIGPAERAIVAQGRSDGYKPIRRRK